jgi:hypothetical protein
MSVNEICRLNRVCKELDVPLHIFFIVSYFRKYGVVSNRYEDLCVYIDTKEIPQYVQEHVDAILIQGI